MIWYILILIILVSLIVLGRIVFRHLPDLKNLDTGSIAEEQQSVTKEKILQAKLARSSAKLREKINIVALPALNFLKGQTDKLKAYVAKMEAQYQSKRYQLKPQTAKELIGEANILIEKGEFDPAEKKLIEVIAKDKKNIEAYELLSNLYFENKSYQQAEEVIKHLLKLKTGSVGKQQKNQPLKPGQAEEEETDFLSALDVDPSVAVYYDDLEQIYEAMGQWEKSLDACLKATTIEPNNPKYLDKLIELSVKIGDKGLAKKTFNQLKETNPDNAKLTEFKESIEKM